VSRSIGPDAMVQEAAPPLLFLRRRRASDTRRAGGNSVGVFGGKITTGFAGHGQHAVGLTVQTVASVAALSGVMYSQPAEILPLKSFDRLAGGFVPRTRRWSQASKARRGESVTWPELTGPKVEANANSGRADTKSASPIFAQWPAHRV